MKVLHIINSLETGGAEKLLLDLIPRFNRSIQCDLLVLKSNDEPFLIELKNTTSANIIELNSRSLFNPMILFKLIKYFRSYDIVHAHLFPTQYWVVFAKLLSATKFKLFLTEHCTTNRRMEIRVLRTINRTVYSMYDRCICITEEIQKTYLNYTDSEKIKFPVVENGINLTKINNAVKIDLCSFFNDPTEHDKYLIQVSAFREQKDQKTLIRSMELLPNSVKLLLVGDGVERSSCETLVEELDLSNRVLFLGLRFDVASLIKSVDICVLSTFFEGLSLSCLEGMASGNPFIASDVPGITNIVKDNGVLFPLGDYKTLAYEINRLLTNEEYNLAVVNRCLQKSKEYSIDKMIEGYLNLYKSFTEK